MQPSAENLEKDHGKYISSHESKKALSPFYHKKYFDRK